MKKSLMLFAASTMLLFAACNKDEVSGNGYTINGDQITFGMGMQSSDDKQGFHGSQKQVYFSAGDQIYVNNVAYNVVPLEDSDAPGSSASYSPIARVTAARATDGRYDFMYPVHALNYDGTRYNAVFPDEVQALDGNINNMMDASILTPGRFEQVPIIPMYYAIPDINQFNGRVLLKNTVSFLAPGIVYGDLWANKVFKPLTDITYDANQDIDRPTINLYDGRIKANFKLTGAAHLDITNAAEPVMVYDTPLAANEWDVLRFKFPIGAQVTAGQETMKLAGMLPIAPNTEISTPNNPVPQKKMRMVFSMTVDLPSTTTPNGVETFYMVFMTNEITLRTYDVFERNTRNYLSVNFNEDRCTYTDGVDNYATNRGGEIVFNNGKLYISNDVTSINNWMTNNVTPNF